MQTELSELLPVRGSDATEILINDHDVIKRMLDDLATSTQMKSRKTTLEQLKGILTIHNATEENLVYPALRQIARKRSEALQLYHETAEADMLVFKLDSMLKEGQDDEFTRAAEKLRDAVFEHIEDEEQSAFPHLQKAADAQQARTLTEEVRKFRSALRFSMGATTGRATTGEV
jgi:hemerythrin superfamily protein